MTKLILFNKPYGVLSQFRADSQQNYQTLADYFTDKSLRVAGRLDVTSEGLLLLTDNVRLNQRLTKPANIHNVQSLDGTQGKTYWVQVEGIASQQQIQQLQQGVLLKDGMTLPARVKVLTSAQIATIWQAPDKIAKRAKTTWLAMTIFEGKNRQIRRMTAYVGLPCLRLIRVSSHGFELQGLAVGEFVVHYLSKQDVKNLGVYG